MELAEGRKGKKQCHIKSNSDKKEPGVLAQDANKKQNNQTQQKQSKGNSILFAAIMLSKEMAIFIEWLYRITNINIIS